MDNKLSDPGRVKNIEDAECLVCRKLFKRYVNKPNPTKTCSRACGYALNAQRQLGTKRVTKEKVKKIKEIKEEDGINALHRGIMLGVDCPYGEGMTL